MSALSVQNLKAEFRLTFDGDPWGSGLDWWFSVADEIYFNRPALSIPDEWKFRPSPLGPSNDPDSYETGIVQEASDEALMQFGLLLTRYCRFLRYKGIDY